MKRLWIAGMLMVMATAARALSLEEVASHNAQAAAKVERVQYEGRLAMTSWRDVGTTVTVFETLEVGLVVQCGKLHISERQTGMKNVTGGRLMQSLRRVEIVGEREIVRARYKAPPDGPPERTPERVEFQSRLAPSRPAPQTTTRLSDSGWAIHRVAFSVDLDELGRKNASSRVDVVGPDEKSGKVILRRLRILDDALQPIPDRVMEEMVLDPAKGWLVVQKVSYTSRGEVQSDVTVEATEISPGTWFPSLVRTVAYQEVNRRMTERSRGEATFTKVQIPENCAPEDFTLERLGLPDDFEVQVLLTDGTWETLRAAELRPSPATAPGS